MPWLFGNKSSCRRERGPRPQVGEAAGLPLTVGSSRVSTSASEDGENSPRGSTLSEGAIPDEFVCALSRQVMRDPVVAADGHSYERVCIEE